MTIQTNTTIHAALQPFVDDGSLAGAVALVADADKILSLDTVGYADIAAQSPMQPDTLVWIASMTKPITAAAVMILVDEGHLSIDDPVTKYLPEFHAQWMIAEQDDAHILLKKPSRAITVRDLLMHTSGMPFASYVEQPTLDGVPLRESVLSYVMTPLQSEPGARYSYSNAAINTAARVLAVVSGTDYVTFLQTRLLTPLGMTDTTFWPNQEQLGRLAKAYRPNSEDQLEETLISQFSYPLDDPKRTPMAAGGLFSTAADVARFCQMFLNKGQLDGQRYLSEATVEAMTHGESVEGLDGKMGLGWHGDSASYGHGGALSTQMSVRPPAGRVLVYLVQHAGFPRNGGESYGAFCSAALEEV